LNKVIEGKKGKERKGMHYGSPIPPKTCASSNRGYAKNLTRDKIDRNKVMGRTSPEKGGA
jgi:hypothetical protein